MRCLLYFRQTGAPVIGDLRVSLRVDTRFNLVRPSWMAPVESCDPSELVLMRSGWGKVIESTHPVFLRGSLSVTEDGCVLWVDWIGEGNNQLPDMVTPSTREQDD